jgi:hypothetical protein
MYPRLAETGKHAYSRGRSWHRLIKGPITGLTSTSDYDVSQPWSGPIDEHQHTTAALLLYSMPTISVLICGQGAGGVRCQLPSTGIWICGRLMFVSTGTITESLEYHVKIDVIQASLVSPISREPCLSESHSIRCLLEGA